jgi:tRNA-dihydrouridine synthase B
MNYLKIPFQLGNITLPNNIFYAPLAGCSDFPFRKMSAKYRPGLMYCEMVKMDALIRHDQNTFHILDYDPSMHPIGGQICGSKPEIAGQAAKIIEDLGFDVVDLNCGCPVDKVTKDGSGSGMLKTPELIGEVLANMVAAVKIPVTVKIRAG